MFISTKINSLLTNNNSSYLTPQKVYFMPTPMKS